MFVILGNYDKQVLGIGNHDLEKIHQIIIILIGICEIKLKIF
jgi:hypothetical protein